MADFNLILLERSVDLLEFGKGRHFEGYMFHADLFRVWQGRTVVRFSDSQHVMVILYAGAEK